MHGYWPVSVTILAIKIREAASHLVDANDRLSIQEQS